MQSDISNKTKQSGNLKHIFMCCSFQAKLLGSICISLTTEESLDSLVKTAAC